MKYICVFGSSSEKIDRSYLDSAQSLAACLCRAGYGIVFGAGKYGIMGAAGRGAIAAGGSLVGVSPKFLSDIEVLYDPETTPNYREVLTETMRERKAYMEESSDAFVICPGGIGTFEEFFEVLTLKQLGRHDKPIILYNSGGFFDSMTDMLSRCVAEKFMSEHVHGLYSVAETEDEVLSQLENYTPYQYNKYG